MSERRCMHCKQPGGRGPRELRPYGPNGQDVCAECVLGKGAPGERAATARQQLGRALMAPGPLILDTSEQAGPRPMKRGKS